MTQNRYATEKEEIRMPGNAGENMQDNGGESAEDTFQEDACGTVQNEAQDSLEYYREAYERERQKSNELAVRLAATQNQVQELNDKINQIKGTLFWRASKPFRSFYHFLKRTKARLSHYGSIKGILRKIESKYIEKKVRKSYGTASFPTPEVAQMQRETKFDRDIKFSILVPLYNTAENFLTQMIDSVKAQTYENWELCLADGSDGEHAFVGEICAKYCAKDPRIVYKKLEKNEGISGNTNQCYSMATGQFIGLFDHDDILHPCALYEYMKVICEQGADYIYCDETTFKGDNVDDMITLHFKPDFAIDNLRANNYICHFSVFDRTLLEGTELFRSEFDGSQDHDMILRLTTAAKKVVHVPKLLYYWRSHAGSVASDISAKSYAIDAAKGAVADHLRRAGFQNFEIVSTRAFETIFQIRYQIAGRPKVSVLIPNKDHLEDLKRCITSILEKSTYDNFEIIIIENNSESDEIFKYYDSLKEDSRIKVVTYEGEFNYSKINNFGERYATGDYLILLNNDTQVISLDWIEELLMYAQRPDVGAVGAKLYYGDKTIQHAGVVLGLGAHRTAGHSHYRIDYQNLGYMGKLCYAQNVAAVTGACLMVKRSLFEEVGGLDEAFTISLNDVDFCLKLLEKGLLNVFTPFAELYHFESISRGMDDQGEKAERYNKESAMFKEKWKEILEKGDPYYNPNFSLDRSDYSLRMNESMNH